MFADESEAVRCVDMGAGSFVANRLPWPTFHRDALRRGSVTNLVTGVDGAPAVATTLRLVGAPNPARGALRFALTRGALGRGDESVLVALYDVRGRRVRALSAKASAGATGLAVTWDGADDAGRAVPAGLYFARARWGGEEATTRVVRLP